MKTIVIAGNTYLIEDVLCLEIIAISTDISRCADPSNRIESEIKLDSILNTIVKRNRLTPALSFRITGYDRPQYKCEN